MAPSRHSTPTTPPNPAFAWPRLALGLSGVLLIAGCYEGVNVMPAAHSGGTDGGDSEGSSSTQSVEDTDEGTDSDGVDVSTMGVGHLQRLSDWEYANTIRELFGAQIADDVAATLASRPQSRSEEGYSRLDQSLTASHVDADFGTALAIARRVSTDEEARAQLRPCLADPDSDCIEAFTAEFGRRVYRRPITEDEQARMLAVYDDQDATTLEARLENLILYLLQTPQFLYRVEIEGPEVEGDSTYRLSDYEMASRLSYFVWGSMPDEVLFEAAAEGLDAEALQEQAERLLDDPRARVGIRRFYEEWLKIEDRPGLEFSEGFLNGLPIEGLRDDMMAEPVRLGEQLTLEGEGSLADLWTTRTGFATTPGLAALYGVQASDTSLELPEARRGLLTRAALLVSPGEEASPIRRGAFISERLLCNPLTPPDPTSFPPDQFDPPAFDPDRTNRERWEEKTSPLACQGCHQYINPYGFAAEGYDAIGRTRTHEDIRDPEGEIVNSLRVDTRTEAVMDGDTVAVADLVELGAALMASEQASRCFVEQWFAFGLGRHADPLDDETIDALAASARDLPLRDLLIEIIASPQFRHVSIEP